MNSQTATLKAIEALPSVMGLSLIDEYGELLHSTIESQELNEYISFIAGTNEALVNQLQCGSIRRIGIKGPKDHSLLLFMDSITSLAILMNQKTPLGAISQTIESLLEKPYLGEAL